MVGEKVVGHFSTNSKVQNLIVRCDQNHPSKDSNPRYYNYLKSSSKLSQHPIPSTLLNENQSLKSGGKLSQNLLKGQKRRHVIVDKKEMKMEQERLRLEVIDIQNKRL